MNNAEWMKLLKKQRERESVKVKEVKDNASVINNGDGDHIRSDAGNGTGGADSNLTQPPELGDNSGDRETEQTDNGDAQ